MPTLTSTGLNYKDATSPYIQTKPGKLTTTAAGQAAAATSFTFSAIPNGANYIHLSMMNFSYSSGPNNSYIEARNSTGTAGTYSFSNWYHTSTPTLTPFYGTGTRNLIGTSYYNLDNISIEFWRVATGKYVYRFDQNTGNQSTNTLHSKGRLDMSSGNLIYLVVGTGSSYNASFTYNLYTET